MRFFWILILSIFTGAALAQPYPSKGGKFQVDQISGCAPLNLTVTIDPLYPCGACDIDLDGHGTFYSYKSTNQSETFSYENPGIYWLKALLSPGVSDSIQITVIDNHPPVFDVYTCGNNAVSVKINDTAYDEYVIDYNDGSPAVIAGSGDTHQYMYTTSDPQTVTVRGRNLNAADQCDPAGKIITPLANLEAPTITRLEVLNDESIRLEFDAFPNVQYKLGIATNNGTTFQQAKTISGKSVDTIFNLRTSENYYCFQLAAFDPCNNAVLNSATICSTTLDLSVRNNAIDVRWNTATTDISGFQLRRDGSDGATLTTTPGGSPYADLGVLCGIEYCYQLTANYPNGSQSISISKCGTGFSTNVPTSIENTSAVITDQGILLQWQTDPNFTPAEFRLEKSVGGQAFGFLSATTQTAFLDDKYNTEESACYRISYTDVCDNTSLPGLQVCPIRLTGNLLKDNSINLTWTPYQGWKNGVSAYVVEKYSEDGVLLQTFQTGTNTSYIDESDDLNYQTFIYVVKAMAVESDIVQAVSNRIYILKDPNLFHPTAFTPNGDNLNDKFTVLGQYVVGFEMQIFNRWGELLFTTSDIGSGWDGTFRGNEMPEGTYTFIAHITDRAGRTFKRSGSVLLLRRE